MSSYPRCRLIVDAPAAGDWNMAVDEALLAAVEAEAEPCLRFYQWAEPTLSLGYFQRLKEREQHAASRQSPVVRRPSGGGAILHDQELTYSFLAPRNSPWAKDALNLYRTIHQSLIEVLGEAGIAAELCQAVDRADEEPFLCFGRRAEGDVLLGVHKIAGSAQRRPQGAILQHGSILLARSPAAPELPGLAELAGRSWTAAELIEAWQPPLQRHLGLTFAPWELPPRQVDLARKLVRSKYGSDDWTARR